MDFSDDNTYFSFLQDTYCEEMYNLDNDSFLNSLETVAMPTMLWSVAPNSDSDVWKDQWRHLLAKKKNITFLRLWNTYKPLHV